MTRYLVTALSVTARSESTAGPLSPPWISDCRARFTRGSTLPADVPAADIAYLLAKGRIAPVRGRPARENGPPG